MTTARSLMGVGCPAALAKEITNPATATGQLQMVTRQAAIANSAAAPTQAEFNAVLAALRAAGILMP